VHGGDRPLPPPGRLSGHHSKNPERVGRTLRRSEPCRACGRVAGVASRGSGPGGSGRPPRAARSPAPRAGASEELTMFGQGPGTRRARVGEVDYHLAMGGSGPPVLLLHGFPQTHYCWRKVAPRLAGTHTVVAPDLRGYGDTVAPPGGPRGE